MQIVEREKQERQIGDIKPGTSVLENALATG